MFQIWDVVNLCIISEHFCCRKTGDQLPFYWIGIKMFKCETSLKIKVTKILFCLILLNLTAMQEMWVWSLSQEDPLEKGMATHSSILTCRVPWTEELGGLQSIGWQRIGYDWATNTFIPSDLFYNSNIWNTGNSEL